MRTLVIAIYGAPGSGKGTQANLLAWKRDYFHFDSGRYLESIIRDPANKNNKIIQREKKLFDAGILMTPSWVLKMTGKKATSLGEAKITTIFSGTPRTMFEAFGDKKNTGVVQILNKYFGRKNMYFFFLNVKPETSIKRNSRRRVCSVCAMVINASHRGPVCPICFGKLRRRTLDDPKIIKERLIEYEKRTLPILKELKKRGYRVITINAEPLPSKVFEQIERHLP